MVQRPPWWGWALDLSSHVLKRMVDRRFTEVDLRAMLEQPVRWEPDFVPGRWIVAALHEGRLWEVVLEPDERERLLIVVTAYPTEE